MAELSLGQQGIWLTEQAGIAGTAYHMGMCLRFEGGLDSAALLAACRTVPLRHPILAAGVDAAGGDPRWVRAVEPTPVLLADLSGDRVAEEIRRPFDLKSGPLARFVVDVDGARPALLFVAHHLINDGTSKDILLSDLAEAYNAGRRGVTMSVRAHSPSYEEFATRQRAVVADLLPAAREFWRPRWREPDDVVLPGLVRTPLSAAVGEALPVTVESADFAALDALVGRLGATRFEILLAVVHTLLHRYGSPAPAVAIDVSTRTEDTSGLIGYFVNELPVWAPGQAGTFRDLVAGLRRELRELYRFRPVPIGHGVPGLRPRTAVAPVSMSYRRRRPAPEFDGLQTTIDWALFSGDVRNALHLQIIDDGDRFTLTLQYSRAALPSGAAHRIAEHLRTVLSGASANPDRALADLPIFSPGEPEPALRAWNATEHDHSVGTLSDLVRQPARRDPNGAAPNGTVDRAGPPMPADADSPQPTDGATADETPEAADEVTAQILDIWREVLHKDDIRVADDLFDLGGHSLTMIRIIAHIEKELGVNMSINDFFEDPTCIGVAAVVRRQRSQAVAGGRQ